MMLRLTTLLLMSFSILSGCFPTPEEIETEADFCAIEEMRRFTQEEWDWRSVNAPVNLRRDIKTNTAWEREECDLYAERLASK